MFAELVVADPATAASPPGDRSDLEIIVGDVVIRAGAGGGIVMFGQGGAMMLVERKGPPLPIQVQESPFARKLGAFVALTSAEFDVLEALHKRRRNFPAGRDLIYQGQTQRPAYILASGWACSYKILSEGTRQIIDVQIPGDFLGLRSMLFRVSDHNIEPLTGTYEPSSGVLKVCGKTPYDCIKLDHRACLGRGSIHLFGRCHSSM